MLNIKLSSSNFMLWKTHITHILRAQKLFGFLDGSKPCPPAPVSLPVASNPPTAAEAAAKLAFDAAELVFEDWVVEDQRLCGLLFSSSFEEAMSEVIGCSTSQQIWETLFSVYQNRSRSSILQLWDQVLNLRRTGVSQEKIASCGLGAVQILSTGVATWLMDKAGRRILLIVSSIGVTISLTIVSAAFFIEEAISEDSNLYGVMGYLAVAGVVAMVACFSIGLGPIPWLIMSEILPVNIKGFGGSAATMAYFLMSWLVTLTANSLLDWSEGGTFAIYTGFAILVGIFVAMLLPETRGKSLEEIQLSFS